MASQSTKFSGLVRSLLLSLLIFKIHPCIASEFVPPGLELPKSFHATDSTASSVLLVVIKIGASSYFSNIAQEGIFSCGCFPSRTNVVVFYSACTILVQFFGLQNSPLFSFTEKSICPKQFSFQDELQKRTMMLLLGLNPTIFPR